MAFTQTVTQSWQKGQDILSYTINLSADGEDNRSVAVPASTTDREITIAIDVSALVVLVMACDQAVTVKTNSTSAPDNTFTLAPNAPLFWYNSSALTNPLGTDVTALYVTNATPNAALFQLRVLQDTTP